MNPLIVALDVPERERVLTLARQLQPEVGMVKIGLEGFVAHGPELVREVRDLGVPVFLDLKLHDIPRTAAAAARAVAPLGVRLLTVHASGGVEMVRAVRDALPPNVQVVAVTVLTSLGEGEVGDIFGRLSAGQAAAELGARAMEAGADGLVCSANELAQLGHIPGSRVVPGIRRPEDATEDQKRTASPAEAVRAGATWIVMGRPILRAVDPVGTARAVVSSL